MVHRWLSGLLTGVGLSIVASLPAYGIEVVWLGDENPKIKLDGRLDESVWEDLPAHTEFIVTNPVTLDEPIHPTVAKAFYTERGLYVGVFAEQPKESIISRLSSRDQRLRRDSIGVGVDASGEGLFGYMFTYSLGGAIRDGVILPERSYTWEWDGPIEGGSVVLDNGWSAEVFIPWAMMALPKAEGKRNIGLYLSRHVGYLDQVWSYPSLPSTKPRFISAFQPVSLKAFNPEANYAIYPFTSASYDTVQSEMEYRLGADIFWRPMPGIKVDATLLPDFGQIEQDDLDINLTAFETFFPEKRPFFLEGLEIFDTGVTDLVFTRRIGAPPEEPDVPAGFEFKELDLNTNSDLYGAVKSTGQLGRFRYGVMTAFEEDTDLIASNAGTDFAVTQTGRDFGTLRLLYENSDNGYLSMGVMSTLVDYGDDTAVVHEVDSQWRNQDGSLAVRGQIMRSDVFGDTDIGVAGDVAFTPKRGYKHTFTFQAYGDDFKINDFGFLRRNDLRSLEYAFVRQEARAKGLNKRQTDLDIVVKKNTRNELVDASLAVAQTWQFTNRTTWNWSLGLIPHRYDDRNSRGNGSFKLDSGYEASTYFETDTARRVSMKVELSSYKEDLGDISNGVSVTTRYDPSDRVSMGLTLALDDRHGWLVHQGSGQFTTFESPQWQPKFDLSVFLSAKQQLRMVWQWIGLHAEEEDRFQVDPTSRELYAITPATASQDFSLSDTFFQLRFKWELAPLSDLFFVYSKTGHSELAGVDDDFDQLFTDIWRDPITEQFTVKLRYRFGS